MKNRWSCATALMLVSCPVLAQSSVTIYGLISEGIGWVNNEGGAHNYKLVSGPNQNNRFGFKVVEDLGGGNRAIAQLENGFDITNGRSSGKADRMFGRQAFVGLSSNAWGTVTTRGVNTICSGTIWRRYPPRPRRAARRITPATPTT